MGDIFTNNQGIEFAVEKYNNAKSVDILFFEPYSYRCNVRASHIKTGSIKNPFYPDVLGVGYTGVGNKKTTVDGVATREYSAWRHMLLRCYDKETQKRQPTYIGCTVACEWHNFQVFAEWFSINDKGSGWELDKDILSPGNKIYSKENCSIVPKEINSLLTDSYASRGELPIGVTLSHGRYMARIRNRGISEYIGMFGSPAEAFDAYRKRKSEIIVDAANRWKLEIGDKVYMSLLNISHAWLGIHPDQLGKSDDPNS